MRKLRFGKTQDSLLITQLVSRIPDQCTHPPGRPDVKWLREASGLHKHQEQRHSTAGNGERRGRRQVTEQDVAQLGLLLEVKSAPPCSPAPGPSPAGAGEEDCLQAARSAVSTGEGEGWSWASQGKGSGPTPPCSARSCQVALCATPWSTRATESLRAQE